MRKRKRIKLDYSLEDLVPEQDGKKWHDRFYFPDGTVIFLVQDTYYNVHRHFFQAHSAVFASLFTARGQKAVGLLGHAIHLKGVETNQFDCLLSVFYPKKLLVPELETVQEWEALLVLAMKWEFKSIFEFAKPKLHAKALPVDKIILARNHRTLKEWRKEGILEILHRSKATTIEEGRRLGVDDVALIEQCHDFDSRSPHKTYEDIYEEVFGLR